jgi:hypothetical protein
MSVPPCVLYVDAKAGYAQTFVADTTGCPAELLTDWAAARVVGGDGAFARVRLFNENTFLVLTLARAAKVDLAVRAITTGIAGLPGAPRVAWVRPLNRRLQALFGWGDVTAGTGEAPSTELALPAQLPDRPACAWRQRPTAPQPFFVQDYKRWSDEDKVAWLRQELGDRADVQDFARKWLELFGDATGAASPKAASLKLFGLYSGSPWRKEADLPPAGLTEFQRIWDPAAPERCSECSKAAPPHERFSLRRLGRCFCSEACACVGEHLACRRCGGPVDVVHPRCTTCGWGFVPEPPRSNPNRLDAFIERNELALIQMLRITRTVNRVDDSREQAWKKRRRA